jgi:hypothetical protein
MEYSLLGDSIGLGESCVRRYALSTEGRELRIKDWVLGYGKGKNKEGIGFLPIPIP